jgi:hypothetical protein
MSDLQALFDYSPGHIGAVESAISIDRFQPYLVESGGDKLKALHRYERNTLLSEALYVPLHGVEIVIRNAFHTQLSKCFGSRWFEELDTLNILDPHRSAMPPPILQKLRSARDQLRRMGKSETGGRVVSELSFGFWTGICAKRYHTSLWTPCLHRPFNAPRPARSDVFERLDQIRGLRNRVAHHEPILSRDLAGDFDMIMETIRWICGASATWIEAISCFRQRFEASENAPSSGPS